MHLSTKFFFVSLIYLSLNSFSQAQNKVVVIPMAGETVVQEIDTFDRTIIVGGSGTSEENAAALLAAIPLATNPTADNPWLIHIEPGVFDLAQSKLDLPAYVSLQGSGVDITVLLGNAEGSAHAVVELSGNNSIADISVTDVSTGTSSSAVSLSGDNVRVQNVKVDAADEDGIRIETAVSNVVIIGVESTAADRAVSAQFNNSNVVVRDSVLRSSGDNVVNVGNQSEMVIYNSTIESTATNSDILNLLVNASLSIYNSQLSSSSSSFATMTAGGPTGVSGAAFNLFASHIDNPSTFTYTIGTATCRGNTTPTSFLETACD